MFESNVKKVTGIFYALKTVKAYSHSRLVDVNFVLALPHARIF